MLIVGCGGGVNLSGSRQHKWKTTMSELIIDQHRESAQAAGNQLFPSNYNFQHASHGCVLLPRSLNTTATVNIYKDSKVQKAFGSVRHLWNVFRVFASGCQNQMPSGWEGNTTASAETIQAAVSEYRTRYHLQYNYKTSRPTPAHIVEQYVTAGSLPPVAASSKAG